MVVQHNLTAMNANRYLGINNNKLSKSLEKLSSGYQINRAGDNAAGLAVSEKMRSQIAGMTQGVKNAQDGISMVQTFEGALTETHSILQRMKTLADQMANGSYDDPVDRTAAQQEFLQLNDELDQIADTDFNGVIVLNGGQMADGTKAVNGQFDYKNGNAVAPTKLGKDNVNVLDSNTWDDAGKANTAWKQLNATWTRQTGQPNTYGPNSVDITFQYDKSTSSWKATSATNGASIKNVATTATSNGGFAVKIGNDTDGYTNVANVVMDQTVVNNGDTITLTLNNPSAGISAPTNTGAVVADDTNFTEHDLKLTVANNLETKAALIPVAEQKALADANTAVGVATTANNKALEAAIAKIKEAGAEAAGVTGTTKAELQTWINTNITDAVQKATAGANLTAAAEVEDTGLDATEAALAQANDDQKTAKEDYDKAMVKSELVTSSDMTADVNELYNQLNGATLTAKYSNAASVGSDFVLTLKNGTELVNTTGDGDPENGTEFVLGDTTFKMVTDAENGLVSITDSTGNKVYYSAVASAQAKPTNTKADPPVQNSTGSITWTLGIDMNEFDKGAKPTVEVAKTGSVSKSNAFNKSEAILTYKDNITLQVGARTKDAVNFTFQYASTSIGDLKDDLDCTSRGLGTAKLNINSQEDANYAIDKIDQAINKVSLIRGTFGAIQNRLEHKIDNMNVSIENLTSAESQIRDTNMPQEMMNFTKNQILAQASQSMLAQANQLPQSVLSLLQ